MIRVTQWTPHDRWHKITFNTFYFNLVETLSINNGEYEVRVECYQWVKCNLVTIYGRLFLINNN